MEKRIWRDPRTKRRFHINTLNLELHGVGFTLGDRVAVRAASINNTEDLAVAIFAPSKDIIVRQQVLTRLDFDPSLHEVAVDPDKIAPIFIHLRRRNDVDNRVYISDDISLARTWAETGLSIVVASSDPNLQIVSQPPETDLGAKLRELKS